MSEWIGTCRHVWYRVDGGRISIKAQMSSETVTDGCSYLKLSVDISRMLLDLKMYDEAVFKGVIVDAGHAMVAQLLIGELVIAMTCLGGANGIMSYGLLRLLNGHTVDVLSSVIADNQFSEELRAKAQEEQQRLKKLLGEE